MNKRSHRRQTVDKAVYGYESVQHWLNLNRRHVDTTHPYMTDTQNKGVYCLHVYDYYYLYIIYIYIIYIEHPITVDRAVCISSAIKAFCLRLSILPLISPMPSSLTTCAGTGCTQRTVCLRAVAEPHSGAFETDRLCYAGFSFFIPLLAAAADVAHPEKDQPCPCS